MATSSGSGTHERPISVLAVASAGGHWDQLLMLSEAFSEAECHYATTNPSFAKRDGIATVHVLPDCNAKTPARLFSCIRRAIRIVRSLRPDVVVTTGAAPGLMCLLAGRLAGAHTIWIDSLANAEQVSLSGRIARHVASAIYTQWSHLAVQDGPIYAGSVL